MELEVVGRLGGPQPHGVDGVVLVAWHRGVVRHGQHHLPRESVVPNLGRAPRGWGGSLTEAASCWWLPPALLWLLSSRLEQHRPLSLLQAYLKKVGLLQLLPSIPVSMVTWPWAAPPPASLASALHTCPLVPQLCVGDFDFETRLASPRTQLLFLTMPHVCGGSSYGLDLELQQTKAVCVLPAPHPRVPGSISVL